MYVQNFLSVWKNPYMYGLFSQIGTCTGILKTLYNVQIILKNPYGLIYKCSFGGPQM